jgi:hypothetical protein
MAIGRGPVSDFGSMGTGAAGTSSPEAPKRSVWPEGGLALVRPPDRGATALKGVTEVLQVAFRVRHKRVRQAGPQVFLSSRAEDRRGSPQAMQTRAVSAMGPRRRTGPL